MRERSMERRIEKRLEIDRGGGRERKRASRGREGEMGREVSRT
jgi:hypothetical protein